MASMGRVAMQVQAGVVTPRAARNLSSKSRGVKTAAPRSVGMRYTRRAVAVVADTEAEVDNTEAAAETEGESAADKLKMSDLAVGQKYDGKVMRLQPYGAFVSIGLKSDGLVHISELKDGYCEKVEEVVSAGQEVTVWIKSIDNETGRFALTMREPRERKPRAPKKDQPEITVKKGDKIKGKVTSVTNFGAFIEVQEGVEGLLHVSEMSDEYGIRPESICKEGEEMEVRVIGIEKGRVQLSIKTKVDMKALALDDGADAMSPFAAAFKAAGLMTPEAAAVPETAPEPVAEAAAEPEEEPAAEPEPEPEPEPVVEAAAETAAPPAPEPVAEAAPSPAAEPAAGTITATMVKELRDTTGAGMMDCKKALQQCGGDVGEATDFLRKKGLASADKKAGRVAAEGAVASYIHMGSRIGVLVEVNCETDFVARGDKFKSLAADIAMQVAANTEVTAVAMDEVDAAFIAKEREIEMGKEDILSKPEQIREKIVEGRIQKRLKESALLEQDYIRDPEKTVSQHVKEVVAEIGENIQVRRFVKFNLGEGIAKKVENFADEVAAQTQKKEPKEEKAPEPAAAADAAPAEEKKTVAVSAAAVKELREATGAGMMDCKKALAENGGDMQVATDFLRKKGLAKADKRAGKVAAEGAVGSYIHMGSRIGVLVEVNCETDFVARGDKFKALVNNIAMQVAANPNVSAVSMDTVDPTFLAKEREIEMGKEDIQSKPEQIREKIVEGRIQKRLKEAALLEQEYIRDPEKTVAELIKEMVAELGENIQVRRFERFNLGEGIEKKSQDFASEVAEAMGQ